MLKKPPLKAAFLYGRDRRIAFSAQAQFLLLCKTGDTPVSPIAGCQTVFSTVQILCSPKATKKPTTRVGFFCLVGTGGFEPSASCSQSKRSTRLSYVPLKNFTFTIISDILLCSPRWFASLAFLLPQNRSTIKLHLSSKNLPPAAFSSSSPKQAQIATGGRSG